MKRKIVFLLCMAIIIMWYGNVGFVYAEGEPVLFAKYAAVIDCDNGRVLVGKKETEQVPMASTTKILTCILALENSNMKDEVKISKYAEKMPRVRMGVKEGEYYFMKDLLYALMLESYNDVAVAIAEHVAGSVEKFANQMNEKAEKICGKGFYFITPNGLDSEEIKHSKVKSHSITAENLAKIMNYCCNTSPMRKAFLKITRMKTHAIQEIKGNRRFVVNNHNAMLSNPKVISGKTGFTAKAGYCYVSEVKIKGHKFCISLLACGWPNNKNYKWKDMEKIMQFLENNTTKFLLDYKDINLPKVKVKSGLSYIGINKETIGTKILNKKHNREIVLLKGESPKHCIIIQKEYMAPIRKGQAIGVIQWYINDKVIEENPIVSISNIEEKTLLKEVNHVFNKFLTICIKTRPYFLKNCIQ